MDAYFLYETVRFAAIIGGVGYACYRLGEEGVMGVLLILAALGAIFGGRVDIPTPY